MTTAFRDPADGAVVERALRQRFASLPMMLLHAAACRPGWLAEIEGVATRKPERFEF